MLNDIIREDWLPIAKGLPVGQSLRVDHGHRSPKCMHIENAPGKYWCYCHACSKGDVVYKEYATLCERQAPKEVHLPKDIVELDLDDPKHERAAALLVGKMHGMFLPNDVRLYASQTSPRIWIRHSAQQYSGRLLPGYSGAKWLHFGITSHIGKPDGQVVLYEDVLSYYKGMYAYPKINHVCCMSTRVDPRLYSQLLKCSRIVCAFDADSAGDRAASNLQRRLRIHSIDYFRLRPPDNRDIKDIHITDIREALGAIHGLPITSEYARQGAIQRIDSPPTKGFTITRYPCIP